MEIYLEGLDCPHCAEEIRLAAEKHKSVTKAEMNFMAKKLTVEPVSGADEGTLYGELAKIIKSTEPDCEPSMIQPKGAKKMEIHLEGLDCPNCAEEVRSAVEKHSSVAKAEMNFMAKKLTVEPVSGADEGTLYGELAKIIKSTEPDCEPSMIKSGSSSKKNDNEFTLVLEDLDCAECGEKIRSYAEKMNGVEKAELNFMAKKLKITLSDTGKESVVETAITGFINSAEPDVTVIREENYIPKKKEIQKERMISPRMAVRLGVTAVLFVVGMLLESEFYALYIFLAAYFIIGYDVLVKAVSNILKGKPFDECFLMTIATIGAFCVGEYPEGVAVMFLYQLGEMFQGYAVRKSRNSITELMDIRPDTANVKRDGEVVQCNPESVAIGDIIVIKPGEKIPLDSVVVSGTSSVDTSALTGESVPRTAKEGDDILSGCVNLSGLIEARVTKEFGESTVSKILELVENSAAKKAKSENFITRFARIYTPCVVAAAVLLAAIPMLIKQQYDADFLYRALSFLVVSCPCALVISVPLSFFSGIGGASKKGILVKGGVCLEQLAKCETIVFDKTGTLTNGTFSVTEVKSVNMSEDELIRIAAIAESVSNHPVALSIMQKFDGELPEGIKAEEVAGKGVKAEADGKVILAGNTKLMAENGVKVTDNPAGGGTVVYVAADGRYEGFIRISDTVKSDSKSAIAGLKDTGVHTFMLTGDRKESADATAKELGIDEYAAELLPGDKVTKLESIMESGKITAFVGDGINDAPVLMRADVGIAMGALGSDAAIEAADVVLMTDEPSKISEAIKISRKTVSIVNQNIIFALGVKLLILILTAFGLTTMWIAVFGDVGVAFIAILNAMRARKA